nr:hypothetical protein [Tanacetum cinerariifolium]
MMEDLLLLQVVLKEMCDKKNSVLFTETKCLILSPDFKLPDENQVLLKILHMDLFGPTFIKSSIGKMYCLVVTDDYSRFSWVFFLAKKDEPCGILKDFITGIENQLNHKVKIIRCDNRTEFKNYEMNQFCGIKGIKRESSNARTSQQNRVAERKNRTLIEAARTMVLVTKPHNKTPYELLIGRAPIINFMRPFGCPVTILNTLDHLGKFDGKSDEGFLVGSGPEWLFDIDSLMNYQPVSARNRTNGIACLKIHSDVGQEGKEKVSNQEYILLPLLNTSSYVPSSNEEVVSSPKDDAGNKSIVESTCVKGGNIDLGFLDQQMKSTDDSENTNSTNSFNTASLPVNTASDKDGTFQRTYGEWNFLKLIPANVVGSSFSHPATLDDFSKMPNLEDTRIFDDAYDDRDEGAEADYNNLEKVISVIPIPSTRIHKDHPKEQIIGEVNSVVQTRKMAKQNEEGLITFINKQRRTNHKYFQNSLFACFFSQMELKKVTQALDDESWVEVMQEEILQFKLLNVWTQVDLPHGKRAIGTKWVYKNKRDQRGIVEVYVSQPLGFVDSQFPNKVYKVEKALYGLHQALRAWYETLSNYILENGFRRGIIDKTLFIKKINNDILLVQVYVDDIIFGLTKRSLMKRIFRYLKGHPTLGLWYPKDLSVELIAYLYSDYVGVNLDRKSTIGGCQFLGNVTLLFDITLVQHQSPKGEGSAIPPEPQPTPSTSQQPTSVSLTAATQTTKPQLPASHIIFPKAPTEHILQSPTTYQQKRKTQTHRRTQKDTVLPQTSVPLNLRADEAVNQEEGDIGIDTGGRPRRQETIGGTSAQTRSERVLEQPNEPPIPKVHTSRSGEGRLKENIELTDTVPTPHDSPFTGGYIPGSDEGRITLAELMKTYTILSNRVTQLETELSTIKAVYNKAFITLTNRERIIEEKDKDENINLVSEQGEVQETAEHSRDDDETLAETLLNIKRSSTKDKGKGIMQETELPKKLKKKEMIQLHLDEELAQKLYAEELAKEEANQEQERYNLEKALELQRQLDQRKENVPKGEQSNEIDLNDPQVLRYHALRNRPFSKTKVRKNLIMYIKNQGGYKQSYFKRMKKLKEAKVRSTNRENKGGSSSISSYHITRADGSMINLLKKIDREDLETLWKLVKDKYGNIRPEEGFERVLWGDLKVMFEPHIESEISAVIGEVKKTYYVINAVSYINLSKITKIVYKLIKIYVNRDQQRVKVNCTSEDTLQHASTSGTQSDNTLVYDSDGPAE